MTTINRPGDVQQLAPCACLQLTPELICTAQQRHVAGVLRVRKADDARLAMAGAAVMPWVELLQAKAGYPLHCQLAQRCAAHCAQADHHCIIAVRAAQQQASSVGWYGHQKAACLCIRIRVGVMVLRSRVNMLCTSSHYKKV